MREHFESDLERLSILSFMIIALLLATDIGEKLSDGLSRSEEGLELAAFALCFLILGAKLIQLTNLLLDPNRNLEPAEPPEESRQWQEDVRPQLATLRVAIEKQFDLWDLDEEERVLTLRTLSGKASPVFEESNATEKLFKKCGLNGRVELLHFFFSSLDGCSFEEQK